MSKKYEDDNSTQESNTDENQIAKEDQLDSKESNNAPDESDKIYELEQKLEKAEQEAKNNWDKFIAAKAEADNIQKRAERDVENAHKFALDKFVPELLAIKDSLEMGTKAAKAIDNPDVDKFVEGSQMTIDMFNTIFSKFNVKEINPDNQESFNPELHQAITAQENNDYDDNTIIEVIQKGYSLNDRLIRPALVVVSKKTN